MNTIDKGFFEILACPECKGKLVFENEYIRCEKCLREYPVKEGVPLLVSEEAEYKKTSETGLPANKGVANG